MRRMALDGDALSLSGSPNEVGVEAEVEAGGGGGGGGDDDESSERAGLKLNDETNG